MGLNVVWTRSHTSISQFPARQGVLVAWDVTTCKWVFVNYELVPGFLTNSIMHVCAHVGRWVQGLMSVLDRIQIWTVMVLIALPELLSELRLLNLLQPLNI